MKYRVWSWNNYNGDVGTSEELKYKICLTDEGGSIDRVLSWLVNDRYVYY